MYKYKNSHKLQIVKRWNCTSVLKWRNNSLNKKLECYYETKKLIEVLIDATQGG